MNTPKIYLIPGLGADGRMYAPQLKVLTNAHVLEHMKPHKGETLTAYARRLTDQIDTSGPFILIGTSLGGILAMEMSYIIHPQKVILISSVKDRSEMPIWMRAMKYLKLHRILTGKMFKRFSESGIKRRITKRDSGVAKLLIEMHRDADPDFVVWAINEVVNWQGKADHRKDVVHLHGTRDILFPHHRISDAIFVKGGTHVMVLTQAQEVNKLLLEAISAS